MVDAWWRPTEESAGGQDGDNEGLAGGGDDELVLVGVKGAKEPEPVLHAEDAADGTGVIAEEDATKGGEGDHEDANELTLLGGHADACACGSWTACHCEGARCGGWGGATRTGTLGGGVRGAGQGGRGK